MGGVMCSKDHKLYKKSSNNLTFYWVYVAFFVSEIQYESSL